MVRHPRNCCFFQFLPIACPHLSRSLASTAPHLVGMSVDTPRRGYIVQPIPKYKTGSRRDESLNRHSRGERYSVPRTESGYPARHGLGQTAMWDDYDEEVGDIGWCPVMFLLLGKTIDDSHAVWGKGSCRHDKLSCIEKKNTRLSLRSTAPTTIDADVHITSMRMTSSSRSKAFVCFLSIIIYAAMLPADSQPQYAWYVARLLPASSLRRAHSRRRSLRA